MIIFGIDPGISGAICVLKEEQYKSAINLLESLEEDDDVQNVYTNLKEKKFN